jgi:hypothetical protein
MFVVRGTSVGWLLYKPISFDCLVIEPYHVYTKIGVERFSQADNTLLWTISQT